MTSSYSATSASSSASDWAPGPRSPQLPGAAVHVWRVDLDALDERVLTHLDGAERARASAIVEQRRRGRWMRARGALKELLGAYLPLDPAQVRLLAGAQGKLDLAPADGRARAPITFNLSHSRGVALFAFTGGGTLGIDVEHVDRALRADQLARRLLDEVAARRLAGLSAPDARRELLRAWTRHEAEAKCLGSGIGARRAHQSSGDLAVYELDVGEHAVATLACERPPVAVFCWERSVGDERRPAAAQ